MTVINFDRVTPALAQALSEFHAAKCAFARLAATPRASSKALDDADRAIKCAEDAIFAAIEAMKVAGGLRP